MINLTAIQEAVCANDLKYLEFDYFPKTQDIKQLELLLEQNHQEQNQTNGGASETTAGQLQLKSNI